MRAHQIMTRSVISITPNATILEAANTMLRYHVSGLPVVDAVGKLVTPAACRYKTPESTAEPNVETDLCA